MFLCCDFSASHAQVLTPAPSDYSLYSISLTNRNSVIFGVQACSDALVAFSEMPQVFSFNVTELWIGANSNTMSLLRRDNETDLAHFTPGILHCNYSTMFWIEWSVQMVSFGVGSIVGNERIFRWNTPPAYSLHFSSMSIATSNGRVGTWDFRQNKGLIISASLRNNGFMSMFILNCAFASSYVSFKFSLQSTTKYSVFVCRSRRRLLLLKPVNKYF